MHLDNITFSFPFEPDAIIRDEQVCRQVIAALFRERPEVTSVILAELPGSHFGLSKLAVLLCHPEGADHRQFNPLVIRMGSRSAIDDEIRRYELFVANTTGFQLAQLRLYTRYGELAAIAYDYLYQEDAYHGARTLRDFLWQDEELHVEPDDITHALRTLFLETLSRGTTRNGWYNDARRFPDQCPLWFYNQLLPPTLHIQLQSTPSPAALRLEDVLDPADRPGAHALHGHPIILAANAAAGYPHLEVVERDAHRGVLRLHLLAGEQAPRSEIYRPFEPVAARIDLSGPINLLDTLPDTLDHLTLFGEIRQTRYTRLDNIRTTQLHPVLQSVSAHPLTSGIRFENPLPHYYNLLSRSQMLHTSIIHGDMNLGNILLNRVQPRRDQVPLAWLIDFDRTMAGGHTVFDAVKLETEYKLHILPHRLQGPHEFLLLDAALHQALVNPALCIEMLGDNLELRKAYDIIATIRRTVLQSLSQVGIPPVEYYLGLLAYGLAALKYANLYDDGRGSWINAYPRLDPPAAAAFLSAGVAAATLPESAKLHVAPPESYPELPRTLYQRPRLSRRRLVGRDRVLAEARQQFQTPEPVVMLYGTVGSGRHAVARALCAELERLGYTTIDVQAFPAKHLSLELCIETLVGLLRKAGVRLPAHVQAPSSKLSLSQHTERLAALSSTLVSRLEADAAEGDNRRCVLVFSASGADTRLRKFIGDISAYVRSTAVIIIADDQWTELAVGRSCAIAPLRQADVQAYVEQAHLPLDMATIERLHQASQGMPRLLFSMLAWAQQHRAANESLRDTVARMSRHQHAHEFARDIIDHLPAGQVRRLELAALLDRYGAEPYADQLFADLASSQNWVPVADIPAMNTAYHLHLDALPGLQDILFPTALAQLRTRREYPIICAYLAHDYATRPTSPNLYLAACYWHAAGNPTRAAQILHTIMQQPEVITSPQSAEIYALTLVVIDQVRSDLAEDLLELAGDCAAYLGRYQAAATHFEQRLRIMPPGTPATLQLATRLLQVYEAAGNESEAARVCDAIQQQAPPESPYVALCLASQGTRLLTTNPAAAAPLLHAALERFQGTRSAWSQAEASFFLGKWVQLADTCARVAVLQGQYKQALTHLLAVRPVAAHLLHDERLMAMLDNNLGYVYELRGQANDLTLAQHSYTAAMHIRRRLGDYHGQMSTGQNLAMLTNDLATTAAEWDAAEEQFRAAASLAMQIDKADRWLVQANYMDLLIRRGKFTAAHQIYTEISALDVPDDYVAYLLRLNRAHLALWEQQSDVCRQYLLDLEAETLSAEYLHQQEWIQYTLECALRFQTTYHRDTVVRLLFGQANQSDSLRVAAMHARNQGLWAALQGDAGAVQPFLEQSRQYWEQLDCAYYAALAAVWQTYLAVRHQRIAEAQTAAVYARQSLEPFGHIPAVHWLGGLEQHLLPQTTG